MIIMMLTDPSLEKRARHLFTDGIGNPRPQPQTPSELVVLIELS